MFTKNIKLGILTLGILGMSSCAKFFEGVNVNPNAANDSPPSALLVTAETRLTYAIGGDFTRFAGVFTKHVDGFDRQFASFQNYVFIPGDFGTLWDNLYAHTLADLKQLKTTADGKGYNAYSGIARALEAHTLMMVADFFGDAPYNNALDADKTFQPTYDSQTKLYETIFALLTEARTKLALAPGGIKPGADDIIYGGSIAKWTKYCNVLAARAYLHLGKVDASNYGKALAELAKGGFASGAEDARFAFTGGTIGDAPWYQYNAQRGDIRIGAFYNTLSGSFSDPRKAIFGKPLDDAHPIFKATQKVPLLTFTEQKFIEAECKMKGNDAAGAKTAMLAGIQSSFTESGVTDAAQYNTYVGQATVAPATVTMTEIMTQKYLSLYTDPEVFNDWRRTNIPALTPNIGSVIPRRFLYPQSEVDLNTNAPKGVKLFDRVSWDKL